MDQAAREGGPSVSAAPEQSEDKTPEEIRADIEQAREELGDTVEALAAKTDISAQAKDRIAQVKETAGRKKDEFAARAREATPDSAGAGAEQIVSTVKDRPVPFSALGGFAAGVLVGWLLGRR
jgi:ElaB/YqjD/DUF883 family membrane-anchored ribosome-binding protein